MTDGYPVLLAACDAVERRFETVDPEYVCFAGVALAWVGEYRRARALLARVTEQARASSALGVLCAALHASAYVDARTGHLVTAYAAANQALTTAETIGNDLWRYFSLGCLAYIEAAQGREEDCRRHADGGPRAGPQHGHRPSGRRCGRRSGCSSWRWATRTRPSRTWSR